MNLLVNTKLSEEYIASIFRAALKMETVYFSETCVSAYKSTRHHKPEQHHRYNCVVSVRYIQVFASYMHLELNQLLICSHNLKKHTGLHVSGLLNVAQTS
jgi:hypothetical protein